MSIYAISDLHLSLGADKPMDIFGEKWENYMEKIKSNWENTVKDTDTVIIGGDISWGMYLNETKNDFEFIEKLPGKKIILKGNHDYWWESLTKMKKFIYENNFSSISFLYNNAYLINDTAICGTRGWLDNSNDNFKTDDEKIYLRELSRMELSLIEGTKLNPQKIIAVLHYPPITKNLEINKDYMNLFKKYSVDICMYGHLHSKSIKNRICEDVNGIRFMLTSADFINFSPQEIII